jgi:hypothetical protein
VSAAGPTARKTRRRASARLGTATVAWNISREAARGAWAGLAEQGGEVALRWVADLDEQACTLTLVDGKAERVLASGNASAIADGELLHIQVAAGEDELVATLRAAEVLYARTTALTRLKIGGGRYEVER